MVMIPSEFLLRTDNPGAKVTSPRKGLPRGFQGKHRIDGLVLRAIQRSHYQTSADAFNDVGRHNKVYLGDRLHVDVHVDEFGNPGIVTLPQYTVRQPRTIRALLPSSAFPRHVSVDPCHLTEIDINNIVLAAINQGVPYSWSVVRPKFGKERAGDILVFWPTHAPFYGTAACDKLGECVDLDEYSEENPLNPAIIHVGVPWLSEQEFGGVYQILCGLGRKRLVVVNCGWYDGGVKKPITFQASDLMFPRNSAFVVQHWAVTVLRNGRAIAIGNTTAAGKTEGSTDEHTLHEPCKLLWLPTAGGDNPIATADLSPSSLLVADALLAKTVRRVVSDDITAVSVRPDGRACSAEIEPVIYNRIDLCTGPGTLPFAEDCANGKVKGRIHWMGVGFDETTRRFIPWKHITLDPKAPCTNPRMTYGALRNPAAIPTGPDNLVDIEYLMISVPVPNIPGGWHMPTFLRVNLDQFFAHYCHGARSNKGNPALGSIGGGYWAFEGFGGKGGFTLDTQGDMFARDVPKFWQSLRHDINCFIVFNGFSMGMRQKFKFAGTFLLRCLLESWHDQLLGAPLIEVPGVYNGGVPDLSTFLPEGALDPRVWDPRVLDQASLTRDALMFDSFGYFALNRILGERGLSESNMQRIGDLMRRYCRPRFEA